MRGLQHLRETAVTRIPQLIDQAREGLDALRAQLAAARQALAEVRAAPPPRRELLARMEALIDDEAARYWREETPRLVTRLSGQSVDPFAAHLADRSDRSGQAVPAVPPRVWPHPLVVYPPPAWSEEQAWRLWAALMPDAAKAVLRAHLETAPYPAAYPEGLAEAERTARVAALVDEIARLERQEEQVIVEARRVGVRLARRAPVQEALDAQAQRLRERTRDLEGQLRAARQAVDTERDSRARLARVDQVTRLEASLAPVAAELAALETIL